MRGRKTASFIARQLSRNRSTITREINKWVMKKESLRNHPINRYKADLAHWCAEDDYQNKKSMDKISLYPALRIYVYRGLLNKWSPEQIAGRIKEDYPGSSIMNISYEAIYMYIYRHRQGKVNKKLIALLPYSRSIRRKYKGSPARTKIKDAVSIDKRPKRIELRRQAGHWEADLMIGIKQASAIGTMVERKTRLVRIIKLKDRKSKTVTREFKKQMDNMHPLFRKTLTYDNGSEMANHKWFTQHTGMKVYFSHPYSAWERGTNENTNGLIRRFLPKQTDFNLVPQTQLQNIEDKLNNRPRKVLG
ncbi:MAG: IS30 family transposase, partial [Nanoarchaeota archaeon]